MTPRQPGPLPDQGPVRVIIDEEKRLIREALAQLLEHHSDVEVSSSIHSLRRLRAALNQRAPDVVVTGLPYVRPLLASMGESAARARVPVVVYATEDRPEQSAMFDALAAGANALLTEQAGSDQPAVRR